MVIVHMVTRLDLQQDMLRKFIILIMLLREWKSVQLWEQLLDVQYRD